LVFDLGQIDRVTLFYFSYEAHSVCNIHYDMKCQAFYFLKLPDSAIVSVCLMCSVHFLR
jgi:hypothetical protein